MTKFLITGYNRTGSHYLASILNSHPDVFCADEIFRKYNKNIFDTTYIQNIWKEKKTPYYYNQKNNVWVNKQCTHYGFVLFYEQANRPPGNYIQLEKFSIILLTRKNLLNRYLSEKLAEKYGFINVPYENKIYINPQNCIEDIEIHIKQEQQLKEKFKNQPLIEVAYEDLIVNHNNIIKFLGLNTNIKLIPQTIKQRVKSQQEMIENYQELKKAFQYTPYITFLDEEKKLFM
jgi:hypothetical protein